MDEPLSNLDAKLRVQTRAEIARLHQRLKTTVVYVTHDQVEAMTMGQRIAVMSEGLLMQVGTPQELYDHPLNQFVAGFIGSPSMNFVDVEVQRRRPPDRPGRLVDPAAAARSRCDRRRAAARSSRASARSTSRSARPAGSSARSGPGPTSSSTSATRSCSTSTPPTRTSSRSSTPTHRVRPGDIVDLVIPLDKLHLFDGETGETLLQTPAATAAA